MASLNLPVDLVSFLQSGKMLEYDPADCEAGLVTLLPVDRLRVEFFPMVSENPDDPHAGESGCYLVTGVSLIATCDGYDPEGLLLWLPLDERYGLWDGEHGTLFVFDPEIRWTAISSDFSRYINAEWCLEGSAPVTDLIPWIKHGYNAEQTCHPLPDLAEWYEAKWVRRGECRDGVQIRYPEEASIRVEDNGERYTVSSKFKNAENAASWSPCNTRNVPLEEWQEFQPGLESGFWNQGSMARTNHSGETSTMWTVSGFRNGMYHHLFRSYDEDGANGDAVHEFGKQLASIARLHHFEAAK